MKQFIQLENGNPKLWPIAANAVWPLAPEGTGFPLDCTDADLTEFGFETFALVDPPTFDPATQRAQEAAPAKANGVWTQQWQVVAYTPPVPPVPSQVTPLQGRLALEAAGKLTAAQTAVNGADKTTQIWFEYSIVWERNNAILKGLGAALGMSSSDIDALFVAASKITGA